MFFSRLTTIGHDYPNAATYGLYGAVALVGAALVIGIADLILARRVQAFDLPSLAVEVPTRR